jgi:hypothetical protein
MTDSVLPVGLREAIIEESCIRGDLARDVLYVLNHVDHNEAEIQQARTVRILIINLR